MSYATLTAAKSTAGSIKNWCNDDSVPSTTVLTEAEKWIWNLLRIREMITTATGNISSGVEFLATPTGYVQAISFWISGINKAELVRKTIEEVEAAREYDASSVIVAKKPRYYYADDTNLQFECKTDQAYPYRLTHYRSLPALAGGNDTNILTSKFPALLRRVCTAHAYEWKKDVANRDETMLARAAADIEAINARAEMEMSALFPGA